MPTYSGDVHLLPWTLPLFLGDERRDVEVIVVVTDTSEEVLAAARDAARDRARVLQRPGSGWCSAVNAGVAASSGSFVLISNADLLVGERYVPEMLDFFSRRPRAACANGKILRYDFVLGRSTDVIDTAGLRIGRNRRGTDRGEGLRDEGRFDAEEQVFGVTGAALFARRAALDAVAADGEYLDEDFVIYKDDLDLSWRLREAGWECWYVPSAVAYHGRTSRGLGEKAYLAALLEFHRNQRHKSQLVKVNSMKNQWLMLVKNEDPSNLVRDLPFICARELAILAYTAAFSPRALIAIPRFARALPSALRKRRAIKARQVTPPRELRCWFGA